MRISACAGTLAVLALGGAGTAAAAGRCGDVAARPWCNVALSSDERAGLLLSALTGDEKVSLLGGDDLESVGGGEHQHTGTGLGVERVGLPTVFYSDGPVGPRQGKATAMPVPMALAATFDPRLARDAGAEIANEVKSKGNDVVFAPTVNIMRTPLNGRTFEAYGEDPFLNSRLTVGWIQGAQSEGVIANVKHFAGNNQEGEDPSGQTGSAGLPIGGGTGGSRYLENSIIDQRTLREIYLPQFEAAIKEGDAGSVMCSYNKLNGQYACENSELLQGILEREWGFDGYVLADYTAAHNTIASLNNGLDFEPFPAVAYSPTAIDAALAAGQAGQDEIDGHVRRILRTMFAFGLFDREAFRDDDAQIDKPAHAATAERIEESAITLLRNEGDALPLDAGKLKTIAVIGKPANEFVTGGGSGAVTPFSLTTALQGITQRAGPGVKIDYLDGSDAAAAAAAAKAADVAIVVAGDYQTEGSDKACLSLECPNVNGDQDALIDQVVAAQPQTVVVLQTGGPVLTPWRDKVKALVEAWYPGQEGGTAIARVLFGDVNPSGSLPATFPRQEADLPTAGDPQKYPGDSDNNVYYKEGVLVGYRWYDTKKLTPAYPFGFGLSYTTFKTSGLRVTPAADGSLGAEVSVDVANTGKRAGTEVAQLYLGLPQPSAKIAQPPRQLKDVARVALAPGNHKRVTFTVDERALSYWNTAAGDWRVAKGCYGVMVGRSSRDIAQQGTVAVNGASCPEAIADLPGGRGCSSRRSIVFHVTGVKRSNVRRVTLYVNGKRKKDLRGRRSKVTLSLRGMVRSTLKTKLVVRTRSGVTIVRRQTFHPCTGRGRA